MLIRTTTWPHLQDFPHLQLVFLQNLLTQASVATADDPPLHEQQEANLSNKLIKLARQALIRAVGVHSHALLLLRSSSFLLICGFIFSYCSSRGKSHLFKALCFHPSHCCANCVPNSQSAKGMRAPSAWGAPVLQQRRAGCTAAKCRSPLKI